MRFGFFRRKPLIADRLLSKREQAGDDPVKHARFHKLVNRYQKNVLRSYILRKRFPFRKWFLR